MWITKIRFFKEDMERITKVCDDVNKKEKEKGGTFPYKITEDEDKATLLVKSDSKNQAYRRGGWLTNNVPEFAINGIGYNVYWEGV